MTQCSKIDLIINFKIMHLKSLKTIEGIEIKGPLLFTPKIFEDSRGFFYESWNKASFSNFINKKVDFVQDNHSKSQAGVLRGLHYQTNPNAQAKLVRCIKGEIFDVIVDLRIKSKTFGKWSGIKLNQNNLKQLWIPEGFAHGFLTISEFAEVIYKTTNYWNKESERTIIWDDKKISINWPIKLLKGKSPILSDKDNNALSFEKVTFNSEIF